MLFNHDFLRYGIVILLPLVRLKIDLCRKSKKNPKTAKTISRKSSVKASAAKPPGNPTPRDEILGLEPATHFYEIEDGDKTEEGEEAETLTFTIKA